MSGRTVTRMLLALTGGLWMAWSAFAQAPQLGEVDKAFVKAAASGGQAEIQLGKLGASRANREAVQEFARRLEKEHTEANTQLLKILNSQGIDVSRDMEPYLSAAKHLESLQGEAFDRAFLEHIIKEHEEAIAHYSKEANEGQNPQLKSFASEMLPSLREHLRRARELAAG
jgi:putative membrane protein